MTYDDGGLRICAYLLIYYLFISYFAFYYLAVIYLAGRTGFEPALILYGATA